MRSSPRSRRSPALTVRSSSLKRRPTQPPISRTASSLAAISPVRGSLPLSTAPAFKTRPSPARPRIFSSTALRPVSAPASRSHMPASESERHSRTGGPATDRPHPFRGIVGSGQGAPRFRADQLAAFAPSPERNPSPARPRGRRRADRQHSHADRVGMEPGHMPGSAFALPRMGLVDRCLVARLAGDGEAGTHPACDHNSATKGDGAVGSRCRRVLWWIDHDPRMVATRSPGSAFHLCRCPRPWRLGRRRSDRRACRSGDRGHHAHEAGSVTLRFHARRFVARKTWGGRSCSASNIPAAKLSFSRSYSASVTLEITRSY